MRKVQVTFYTTYMLFILRIKASNIDVMKIRQSSQQKRMSKITSIIQYPNTAHQWLVNVYFTLVKSSSWHNITISQYQCHITISQYHAQHHNMILKEMRDNLRQRYNWWMYIGQLFSLSPPPTRPSSARYQWLIHPESTGQQMLKGNF